MFEISRKTIAIGLILAQTCLPCLAAPKKAKSEDPLRAKCLPLVQAQICLPKATGGFNCPESLEQEIDTCVNQKGKYP